MAEEPEETDDPNEGAFWGESGLGFGGAGDAALEAGNVLKSITDIANSSDGSWKDWVNNTRYKKLQIYIHILVML